MQDIYVPRTSMGQWNAKKKKHERADFRKIYKFF